MFSDSATEGKTFSYNNFLILTRLSRLFNRSQSMRGLKITVSVEGRIVNPFVFLVI